MFRPKFPLDAIEFPYQQLPVIQFCSSREICFFVRRAARERFPITVVEMPGKLLDDFILARGLEVQACEPLPDV